MGISEFPMALSEDRVALNPMNIYDIYEHHDHFPIVSLQIGGNDTLFPDTPNYWNFHGMNPHRIHPLGDEFGAVF